MIEPKFKKGDYCINRNAGDIAIVKGLTKKGYYQFEQYYDSMLNKLKDLAKYNYELQVNYQQFWDLCNEQEKNKLDKIIKENEKTEQN